MEITSNMYEFWKSALENSVLNPLIFEQKRNFFHMNKYPKGKMIVPQNSFVEISNIERVAQNFYFIFFLYKIKEFDSFF